MRLRGKGGSLCLAEGTKEWGISILSVRRIVRAGVVLSKECWGLERIIAFPSASWIAAEVSTKSVFMSTRWAGKRANRVVTPTATTSLGRSAEELPVFA